MDASPHDPEGTGAGGRPAPPAAISPSLPQHPRPAARTHPGGGRRKWRRRRGGSAGVTEGGVSGPRREHLAAATAESRERGSVRTAPASFRGPRRSLPPPWKRLHAAARCGGGNALSRRAEEAAARRTRSRNGARRCSGRNGARVSRCLTSRSGEIAMLPLPSYAVLKQSPPESNRHLKTISARSFSSSAQVIWPLSARDKSIPLFPSITHPYLH